MDIGFRQAVLRDTSQGAVVSGRWLWRRTNILYMGSDSWLSGPNGAPQDVVAKTGQGRLDSARVAPHKSEHHIFARTTGTGSDSSWQACSLLWTSVLVSIPKLSQSHPRALLWPRRKEEAKQVMAQGRKPSKTDQRQTAIVRFRFRVSPISDKGPKRTPYVVHEAPGPDQTFLVRADPGAVLGVPGVD
ncbi:hypothetical protein B0H10DRAFT_2195985 [Mycena sp. CBHHK59/15]|nr:hypothetical protein B0H10DRAFT_2195985 [Mycena sp. CBHHK59/15]